MVETLPPGFAYVESSLSDGVKPEGQRVFFTLLGEETFSYTVAASDSEGSYAFSGVVKDLHKDERPIAGDSAIMVSISPPPTPTSTPSPVPTPSPTPTASPTPLPSPTPEPTPSPTHTHTPTPAPTATPTLTPIPTPTMTPLPTSEMPPTIEPTPTLSPVPIPTREATRVAEPASPSMPQRTGVPLWLVVALVLGTLAAILGVVAYVSRRQG